MKRLSDDELESLFRSCIVVRESTVHAFNEHGKERIESALKELVERRKQDKEQGPG